MNTYKRFMEEYEYYTPQKFTSIREIAERYYKYGDKAKSNFKTKTKNYYSIMAPVSDIDNYKEYNWSSNVFRNKGHKPEYWDELVEDIKKNGIKTPLTIILYKHEHKAKLGEGNHRLGVAKQLGIEFLPVRFEYYMGIKPKNKKTRSEKEFNKLLDQTKEKNNDVYINKLIKTILGEI